MEQERIINVKNVTPSGSRKKRRGRIIAVVVIAAIAAGSYLFFRIKSPVETISIHSYTSATAEYGQLVSTTEASGTVVLPRQVTIVSPVEGYADKLFTEEGSYVTQSDILATLDAPGLENTRDDLTVSLNQALIELESIKNDYNYQIKSIKIQLARLKTDMEDAAEDVMTLKQLSELKSSRKADYEDAVDMYEGLKEQNEDLEISLEETTAKMDIAVRKQQASIDKIQTSLNHILEDIEETRIKSPIEGEVLTVNESLAIPGSLIGKTDVLFTVADRTESYIDFDVYEQYADQLKPGGTMTVTIGSETMQAEIVKIGKIATMDSDGLSAMVSVRAKPVTKESLTPGASAVASINLGLQEHVLLLPRGAYLTTGSMKWVYRVEEGKAYKTEVTLGTVEGNSVEVLSGLKSGDEIITSSYQNFIDEDVIEIK
ncbi:MAG: hypothetical protein DRP59_06245 [Spirochaetes bacterium]|nr:MAG: hypothetical protein DRP59_06245 [Spirochaetota bacterium]